MIFEHPCFIDWTPMTFPPLNCFLNERYFSMSVLDLFLICIYSILKLQYFGHLMWRVDSLEKTDAGRDRGQEEKGMTEDEMAGCHHWLDGRESEWTPGVGDGQGGLACCDAIHGVAKSRTRLSNWTELNWSVESEISNIGWHYPHMKHPILHLSFLWNSFPGSFHTQIFFPLSKTIPFKIKLILPFFASFSKSFYIIFFLILINLLFS